MIKFINKYNFLNLILKGQRINWNNSSSFHIVQLINTMYFRLGRFNDIDIRINDTTVSTNND
ncbi:unnamed protein product [Paramecium primaurelia]|uniref:Uncharacterized protein n=1 Tax=Paramecium primaurelia TaxID=5886 RepID=A0A8S1PAP8_PARPR|nr:unnamed protein product [Paramecium primaurelia]